MKLTDENIKQVQLGSRYQAGWEAVGAVQTEEAVEALDVEEAQRRIWQLY